MASNSEDCSDSCPPKRLKLDESSSISHISNIDSNTIQFGVQSNAIEFPEETTVEQSSEHGENIADDNILLEVMKSASQSSLSGLKDEDDVDDGENDDEDDEDDDDDDDVASTVSNISDLSGISVMSGQDWKCIAGPISWVQKQMKSGADPRALLGHLFGDKFFEMRCSLMDRFSLWRLIASVLSEPPPRAKLPNINTFSDVIHLLKSCSKIVVLTGAGVSVSCGIPDFRSRNGVYSRLAVDFPDLPDPQSMFDIDYFRKDPRPFFKFAREIFPGQFKPSPCHRFIKKLEENGKLLRNYSQNIDTLEQVAGIKNVVECHGSFATATCTQCQHKVTCEDIRESVFQQKIPFCPVCTSNPDETASGVMKPDIVFFRENLPKTFHQSMAEDKDECDLLIVIGSSLKVYPVALIPSSLPSHVPQILINRESLPDLNFDVELLGDGDVIINQICMELGDNWTDICWRDSKLTEAKPILSPHYRSGYNTEYSEGEGEMSVDWSSPSDRPQSESVNLSVDACMEEEHFDDGEEEKQHPEECRQHALSSNDICGDCGKETNQPAVKCRKIRKIKVRNKTPQYWPSTHKEEKSFVSSENDGRMCVEQEENSDPSMVSRRHLSTDSTRDSGIGDGSNSSLSAERHMSVDSQSDASINLASRLPENSYFYIRPNRYIFEGAEVMDDPSELLLSDDYSKLDTQIGKQPLKCSYDDSKIWDSPDMCLLPSSSSTLPQPTTAVDSCSTTSRSQLSSTI